MKPRFVGPESVVREVERLIRSLAQRASVAWRQGDRAGVEADVVLLGERPLVVVRVPGPDADAAALLAELQRADQKLRGAA
ncbi:MAG: hypothetical protein H6721_12400 [Sandaracinus sp.]|nr:hypothetical protein [Sandaracinus sp.]